MSPLECCSWAVKGVDVGCEVTVSAQRASRGPVIKWATNQWYGQPPTLHLRSKQIKTKHTMILKTYSPRGAVLSKIHYGNDDQTYRLRPDAFRGQGKGGPIESINFLYTVISRIDPRLVACP